MTAVVWSFMAPLLGIAMMTVDPGRDSRALSSIGGGRATLQGIVRDCQTGVPVEQASVIVESQASPMERAETTTDRTGRFTVSLPQGDLLDLRVIVRRVGFRPDTTAVVRGPMPMQICLRPLASDLDTVRVAARRSAGGRALEDARARGWRVYSEEQIAPLRSRARTLTDLVRGLGIPGVIPPRRPGDCLRSARNQQCLAVIVDGFNVGVDLTVVSGDIAGIAVVGLTEARMFFGPLAPNGALVVYTRGGPP